MDIEALNIFVAVARRGSFSPVARERGADPSSISRSIAALEKELGVRLFQRSTRRLTLTEAGSLYLERVEGVAELLGGAREEVQGIGRGPVGTLRLAASVAFGQVCLVPLLAKFRASYPSLKLELLLGDQNVDLISDRIDLAIRLAPSVDVNMIAAKLHDTRYIVCCSPAYRMAQPALSIPSDLVHHRCLRFSLPGYRDRWLFKTGDGNISEVPVDGDVVVSNALVLRKCAIEGFGPALLPDWLIGHDLKSGVLLDCFPDYRVAATSFDTAAWLIYPSRTYLPNKVRVMIDFLRSGYAGRAIVGSSGSGAYPSAIQKRNA